VIAKRLRIKLALIDHFGRFEVAVRPSPAVRGALSGPAGAENRHSAGVTAALPRAAASVKQAQRQGAKNGTFHVVTSVRTERR
jgi:hypothetical protein